MFEKEHMKAVRQAFAYQKDVVHDPRGATTQPFASKLRSLFEVLKYGKAAIRKRFLANLCAKINFELSSVETEGDPPEQLLSARFCLENLAFFDYTKLDEIQYLVSCLEKVVTGTGTSVAHAIETEVLRIRLDAGQSNQQPPNAGTTAMPDAQSDDTPVDLQRLRQLTVASTILSMAWETRTFLRRLWPLKSKTSQKDTAKAANRVPGVTGDKYFEKTAELMTALDSPDAMAAHCRAFAELLKVDNEVRIADEDDGVERIGSTTARAIGYETPDEEDGVSVIAPASGGSVRRRKRRASSSAVNTPKKAKTRTAGIKGGKKRGRPTVSKDGSMGSVDGDEGGWG